MTPTPPRSPLLRWPAFRAVFSSPRFAATPRSCASRSTQRATIFGSRPADHTREAHSALAEVGTAGDHPIEPVASIPTRTGGGIAAVLRQFIAVVTPPHGGVLQVHHGHRLGSVPTKQLLRCQSFPKSYWRVVRHYRGDTLLSA